MIVVRVAVSALLFALLAAVGLPAAAAADVTTSPGGEIVVVTVNAQQRVYDDAKMHALTSGIAQRVPLSPDAVLVNEIYLEAMTEMRDQLNALVGEGTYAIVGATNSVKTLILLNTRTMKFTGYRTWIDACTTKRTYQIVTAEELDTGRRVALAGVHFAPSFNEGGSDACKKTNSEEVRRQMAEYSDSGVIGDFNKRATTSYYECNPEESFDVAPREPWYAAMTGYSTIDNRSYQDTVRDHHYGVDMRTQWSWERATTAETLCDGTTGYRRSRLDYIFASEQMTSIDAATDQGWTSANDSDVCSPLPGCKYSDHRFLWAHLGLSDTVAPAAPSGLAATAGDRRVSLQWTTNSPTDGVANYTVYRDGKPIGTTPEATFTDTGVSNGTSYTYSVTASDSAGNESAPSAQVSATPTAPKMHVGDLDATRAKVKNGWQAKVAVTVHDSAEGAASGATVSYSWSTGATGTCTTSSVGRCEASLALKSSQSSVTFKITNITKSGFAYGATANHDPDGDSTGTAITVSRPA